MYRPYKLLLACPWMNRQDLLCNRCPHRDPPQLEGTDYMTNPWSFKIYFQRTKNWPHGKVWWSAFLDTKWQADECCAMGDIDCFEAAVDHSTFPAGQVQAAHGVHV